MPEALHAVRAHAYVAAGPRPAEDVAADAQLPDERRKALAHRFAEAGFHTLAVDHYGRSRHRPRGGDFDEMAHLALLEPAHVEADAAAAVTAIRKRGSGPVFSIGFCLGGAYSWRVRPRPGSGWPGRSASTARRASSAT